MNGFIPKAKDSVRHIEGAASTLLSLLEPSCFLDLNPDRPGAPLGASGDTVVPPSQ